MKVFWRDIKMDLETCLTRIKKVNTLHETINLMNQLLNENKVIKINAISGIGDYFNCQGCKYKVSFKGVTYCVNEDFLKKYQLKNE